MSHTPGPWTRFDYRVFKMKNNGEHIDKTIAWTASNARNRTPEAMANAHLVSVAPDLLAALMRIRQEPENSSLVELIATAALAKAEGR